MRTASRVFTEFLADVLMEKHGFYVASWSDVFFVFESNEICSKPATLEKF